MANHLPTSAYFNLNRERDSIISTLGDRLCFDREFDFIHELIRNSQPVAAEHELRNLKQSVDDCIRKMTSLLARLATNGHRQNIEMIVMDWEMTEQARLLALANGDEKLGHKLDAQLSELGNLFDASIADLDPDR